jgi:hypothetical protein
MAPFRTLEKQAVKVSHCSIVQRFLHNYKLYGISLVRQATASGSTTGLQALQELPRNLPVQTRHPAVSF